MYEYLEDSSQNEKYSMKQSIVSPNVAAILIQKTWRGYFTRKLLDDYFKHLFS